MFFAYNSKGVTSKTKNQKIELPDLTGICRDYRAMPGAYMELPKLGRAIITTGCQKSKNRYDQIKRELPYLIPSGYRERSTGHADGGLELNGCINIDIDLKHPNGADISSATVKAIKDNPPPGVAFVALSPGTYGVKMIVRVQVEGGLTLDNYKSVARELCSQLSEELQVPFKYFDILPPGQSMYIPFDRPGRPGAQVWPDAAPRDIVVAQEQAPGGTFEMEYTEGETSDAARYLIESGADIADGYQDYVKICFACLRAFGPEAGQTYARALLENCATFESSQYRKSFAQKWRDIVRQRERERGRKAGPGFLVKTATAKGWKPTTGKTGQFYKVEPGEYLAQAVTRMGLQATDVLGRDIIAGTGIGKTTYIASLAARDNPVVIVMPTQAATQNAAIKTKGRPFYGGKDTRVLCEGDFLVFCTVASFEALCSRTDIAGWNVVFDEAHIFSVDGSASFRGNELNKAWTIAKRARSVTTMTGTSLPNFHPDFSARERVTFERDKEGVKGYIYRSPNATATTVQIARDSIAAGRVPIVVLNDKGAKRAGIISELEGIKVACIDADGKSSTEYTEIIGGEMPTGAGAVITTTVLREGNDIRSSKAVDVIFMGVFHGAIIAQITARFRDQNDAQIHIIKGQKADGDGSEYNKRETARKIIAISREQAAKLNNTKLPKWQRAHLYANLGAMYLADGIDEDGGVCIDYFSINARLHELEAMHQYTNDKAQIEGLSEYGYKLKAKAVKDVKPGPTATGADAAKEAKRVKVERYDNAVNAILSAPHPEATAKMTGGKAGARVRDLKKRYNLSAYEAARIIEGRYPGKEYSRIIRRMDRAAIYQNAEYVNSNPDALKFDRAIMEQFTPGERLSGADILGRVETATKADGIGVYFDGGNEDTRKRKAVEILRGFFEVKKSRDKANRGPHKWVYIIEKIAFYGGPAQSTRDTQSPRDTQR